MNKIIVNSKDNHLQEQESYTFTENQTLNLKLEDSSKEFFFTVCKSCSISINLFLIHSSITIHFLLEEDSKLEGNIFSDASSFQMNTILKGERAEFFVSHSLITDSNQKNIISVEHLANHTISKIQNHGFSIRQATIIFDVSVKIPKQATNCITTQDNQIIESTPSFSQINPNLFIDNYEVEASHSAYIGEFKEDALFYFMSRGIDFQDAKILLLKSFLLGNLKLSQEQRQELEKRILMMQSEEV